MLIYLPSGSRELIVWYQSAIQLTTQDTFRILTPYCRWVDISTWTPTPQGCLYLGPSPSDLDNSFFAESVLTSYNFLASLQIILNLEHGKLKFLDDFFIYYLLSILGRRELMC